MAWQLLAAALPAAAKVAGTALNKPKQEDFKPQTDYMKKYVSFLRGRSSNREVANQAMQPAIKMAGRQGRQMQQQIGYDVAGSGLGGSGIEAQMRLSAGQQTQDALATATDKAVAAQTADTARIGEQAAGITAQIGAEEARAEQAYKQAQSQYKSQLTSDVIGLGASVASAGITQAGKLNEAKLMATKTGYYGNAEDVNALVSQGWTPEMFTTESNRINNLLGKGVNPKDAESFFGVQSTNVTPDAIKPLVNNNNSVADNKLEEATTALYNETVSKAQLKTNVNPPLEPDIRRETKSIPINKTEVGDKLIDKNLADYTKKIGKSQDIRRTDNSLSTPSTNLGKYSRQGKILSESPVKDTMPGQTSKVNSMETMDIVDAVPNNNKSVRDRLNKMKDGSMASSPMQEADYEKAVDAIWALESSRGKDKKGLARVDANPKGTATGEMQQNNAWYKDVTTRMGYPEYDRQNPKEAKEAAKYYIKWVMENEGFSMFDAVRSYKEGITGSKKGKGIAYGKAWEKIFKG